MTVDSGNLPVVPLIVGPTGVGKSSAAIQLARLIGGEIVNADSRQVYRHMDIGTAKPDESERATVPHHLFDFLELTESISVGKYLDLAQDTLAQIIDKGNIPIVVGGSTLYTYALTHGLANIPAIPAGVRAQVERRATNLGFPAMYDELSQVDPVSAATMDATKSQRIIRALEVFHGTGKPLSFYHHHRSRLPYRFSLFVLTIERQLLYDRINRRVDEMLESGLVAEVSSLREGGRNDELYPLRSPGYKEVIAFLKGGIDQEEMTRLIKRNTRRYAKRQLTWYRRYEDAYWLDRTRATPDYLRDSFEAHIYSE